MKLGTFQKQPAERTPYTINYQDSLSEGDYITGVEVDIAGTAPTLVIDQVTVLSPRVRFFVAGGADGATYKATFTATSGDGEVFQDEVTFKIKEI